jgi:hypothetical protein
MQRFSTLFFVALFSLTLSGCAGGYYSVWTTLKTGYASRDAGDHAVLQPQYQYLRVTYKNNIFYMPLATVRATAQGAVMEWLDLDLEVMRTAQGRIMNSTGLPVNWADQTLTGAPDFTVDFTFGRYWRERRVMPGYQTLREQVVVTRVSPKLPNQMIRNDPNALLWFKETVVNTGSIFSRATSLPPSYIAFAVEQSQLRWVYSEQCLSWRFCLSLQPITASELEAWRAMHGQRTQSRQNPQ